MENRLWVLDTTLRDGEQMAGVNFNIVQKLEIARQIARLRVDAIEAGFAAASRGDFEAVSRVAAEVRGPVICSLARAVEGDIRAAAQALAAAEKPRIHVFIATSPVHMLHKLRMTPDQVYERACESVALARALAEDVEFSPEDATRTERAFLYRVLEGVIAAGARTINLTDTVGYATVGEFMQLVRDVRAHVRGIERAVISVHCHNDLGLAVANSLSALSCGARQIEATVNGLGERAGNAALEEIAMGVLTRRDVYGLECAIDTRQIYRTSRLVASYTGIEIPVNKCVVGENAFAHASGIHQHGVMSERSTYEIMNPKDIGIPPRGLVLGKLSGKHAFAERARELGYELGEAELVEAFRKFKDLADRKREVSDRDIEALLGDAAADVPAVYELESYQVYAGNKSTATATLCMLREGVKYVEAAVGSGPVDAAFRAVDRLVGMEITLASYNIKAVTQGADALGEVTVRIQPRSEDGATYLGKGVSTDIVEASIIAYIDAVNRSVSEVQ